MLARRFPTTAAVLFGAMLFAATAAQAEMAPAPAQDPSADVQSIADGCGYGYHRTASGRCDNVRDYNAWCQKGFHKVHTPLTASGYRCVQDGY
jgi:hypothetical protein